MKEKNVKELLCKEIAEEIELLNSLQPGSEEHLRAVESLAKLYELKISEEEKSNDKEKLDKDSKGKLIQYGIDVAGIVLPLAFYGIWMKRGLKFEQTGTFTSTTFKGLFQKFKTTK